MTSQAASPSIIQQYGPLIAAVIALLGVLVTLAVTTTRERRKDALAREDAYRSTARAAVADVLAAATRLIRYGQVMSDQSRWAELSYAMATESMERADEAMKELQQHLVTSRLLIVEDELVATLDKLHEAFDECAAAIHDAVDAFWTGSPSPHSEDTVTARWQQFSDEAATLMATATEHLRPTIKKL